MCVVRVDYIHALAHVCILNAKLKEYNVTLILRIKVPKLSTTYTDCPDVSSSPFAGENV